MVSHRLAIQLACRAPIDLLQNDAAFFVLNIHETAFALGKTTYFAAPNHVRFNGNSIRSLLIRRCLGRRRLPRHSNGGRLTTQQNRNP